MDGEVTIGRCGVCGGDLVRVRGKHPNDGPRRVCPTCLADRLDNIHGMSAPVNDYGIPSQGVAVPEPMLGERIE